MRKYLSFLLLSFCFGTASFAQQKSSIVGLIVNEFTKEIIPYASVQWKTAGFGVVADSAGVFNLKKSQQIRDTIIVSYIGFDNQYYSYDNVKNNDTLTLYLKSIKITGEIVIKSKSNRGYRWWKKIVEHKTDRKSVV